MQVNVLDMAGKTVKTITLNAAVFEQDYNEALIHQVVVAYLNNQRQGTKSTLTRSEVRGGGMKPYRQKGTGRARQGSLVAPQHTGGGVVFAPKPRDFSQKVNKIARRAAFFSALSEKARQGEITVIDAITFDVPKTKAVAGMLDACKLNGKTMIVTGAYNADLLRAAGNIQDVTVSELRTLSVYDIVANRNLVLTMDAINNLEEQVK